MRKNGWNGAVIGLAGLALGGAVLAGCGSGDGEDSDSPIEASRPTADIGELGPDERRAVEEYRAFAIVNAKRHLAAYRRFAAALEAGDLERAKAIYPEARMPWERIEPVAGLFGDLDPALDAREGDVPKDTWGGWHYFEKKLWIDETTDGLDPYVEETDGDASRLVEVAETIEMSPPDVAGGAVDLLGEVSASKITGEEERYSHTDLWDFQANVDGSEAAFEAVAPLIADEALVAAIRDRFAGLERELSRYRDGDGFVVYTDVGESARRKLSRLVDATAEPLSQVASEVG